MATTIQIRRDSASNWISFNPTLLDGELGIESDTGKIKIGDGLTAWIDTSYGLTGSTSTISAPSISLNSTSNEMSIEDITITNYDSNVIYSAFVTAGSIDTSVHPFKWTLPSVDIDKILYILVFANKSGEATATTQGSISVLNVSDLADQTASKIINRSNVFSSYTQDSIDKLWNSIDITVDSTQAPLEVGSASTTTLLKSKSKIQNPSSVYVSDGTVSGTVVKSPVSKSVLVSATTNAVTEQTIFARNGAADPITYATDFNMNSGLVHVYTIGGSTTITKITGENAGTTISVAIPAKSKITMFGDTLVVAEYTTDLIETISIDTYSMTVIGNTRFSDTDINSFGTLATNGKEIFLAYESTTNLTYSRVASIGVRNFGDLTVIGSSILLGPTFIKAILISEDLSPVYISIDNAYNVNISWVNTAGPTGNMFSYKPGSVFTSSELVAWSDSSDRIIHASPGFLMFKVTTSYVSISLGDGIVLSDLTKADTINSGNISVSVLQELSGNYAYGYDPFEECLYLENQTTKKYSKTLGLISSITPVYSFTPGGSTNASAKYIRFNKITGLMDAYLLKSTDLIKVTHDLFGQTEVSYDVDISSVGLLTTPTTAILDIMGDMSLSSTDRLTESSHQVVCTPTISTTSATIGIKNELLLDNLYAVDATGVEEKLVSPVLTPASATITKTNFAPVAIVGYPSTSVSHGYYGLNDGKVVRVMISGATINFCTFAVDRQSYVNKLTVLGTTSTMSYISSKRFSDGRIIAIGLDSTDSSYALLAIYDPSTNTIVKELQLSPKNLSPAATDDINGAIVIDETGYNAYLYLRDAVQDFSKLYKINSNGDILKTMKPSRGVNIVIGLTDRTNMSMIGNNIILRDNTYYGYKMNVESGRGAEYADPITGTSSGGHSRIILDSKGNSYYAYQTSNFYWKLVKVDRNGLVVYTASISNYWTAYDYGTLSMISDGILIFSSANSSNTLPNSIIIESYDGLSAVVQEANLSITTIAQITADNCIINTKNEIEIAINTIAYSIPITGLVNANSTLSYTATAITPVNIIQKEVAKTPLILDNYKTGRFTYTTQQLNSRRICLAGKVDDINTKRVILELTKKV